MHDYIRRAEAINRLQEIANDYEDARDVDAFYVADYCLKHIMEIRPAADVRPVKQGYWTDGAGTPVPWDEMNPDCPAVSAYCSACGEWLTASDEYPAIGKFCPNCGADMRKEKDG